MMRVTRSKTEVFSFLSYVNAQNYEKFISVITKNNPYNMTNHKYNKVS